MQEDSTMPSNDFRAALARLTGELEGRPLDADLQAWLNREHGVASDTYRQFESHCHLGIEEGWMCEREAGGIRYGRVFRPSEELHGFSVDVVDMDDVVGPHHAHPRGEIDLVMPQRGDALFDDQPAGWVVYPVGSAHRPMVSNGRALVMYLLPEGSIEFTR
jgi:hypothetical protein